MNIFAVKCRPPLLVFRLGHSASDGRASGFRCLSLPHLGHTRLRPNRTTGPVPPLLAFRLLFLQNRLHSPEPLLPIQFNIAVASPLVLDPSPVLPTLCAVLGGSSPSFPGEIETFLR